MPTGVAFGTASAALVKAEQARKAYSTREIWGPMVMVDQTK